MIAFDQVRPGFGCCGNRRRRNRSGKKAQNQDTSEYLTEKFELLEFHYFVMFNNLCQSLLSIVASR